MANGTLPTSIRTHKKMHASPPPELLATFRARYNDENNAVQHVARNAVTHASPAKVLVDPRRADALHDTFSDELDITTKTSDQQQSGRCWLFSFLNVLRAHMVHKYELDAGFEFSQSYLFFWDQFEKCNLFLHYMWTLRDKSTDDPYVREMLKEPLSDGGQWAMIQNLVDKYGVVPKHCMGESYQANNTERLTAVLCGRLREHAHTLRTLKDVSQKDERVREMLYEVYCVLCVFLGEPPQTFRWEYNPTSENWAKNEWKKKKTTTTSATKSHKTATATAKSSHNVTRAAKHVAAHNKATPTTAKKTHKPSHTGVDKKPFVASKTYTPVQFYKQCVKLPIHDYVTVIHYPHAKRPFDRRYTVKYLNNMVGGRDAELFNVRLDTLKTVTRRAIDAGEPVWFCADIGKDVSTKYGILDPQAFNYKDIFRYDPHGWDKGTRMMYKDGTPNHAMVLRGYHVEPRVTKPATTRANRSQRALRSSSSSSSKTRRARKPLRTIKQTPAQKKPPPQKQPPASRWLVENSWGEYSGKDGNLVMSDQWFDRHVYEVAVHKRHLKGVWHEAPDAKTITLEMWDVFGSLFA